MKYKLEILTHTYGDATIFYEDRVVSKNSEDKNIGSTDAYNALKSISESLFNKVADGDSVFFLTKKQLTIFFSRLKIVL